MAKERNVDLGSRPLDLVRLDEPGRLDQDVYDVPSAVHSHLRTVDLSQAGHSVTSNCYLEVQPARKSRPVMTHCLAKRAASGETDQIQRRVRSDDTLTSCIFFASCKRS